MTWMKARSQNSQTEFYWKVGKYIRSKYHKCLILKLLPKVFAVGQSKEQSAEADALNRG